MMRRILPVFAVTLAVFAAGYWSGLRQTPVQAQSERVFELRTYHCAPGKLNDLLARFRDHTMTIFDRHGMHNVGYWIPVDEPAKDNTLTYMISHDSMAQAKENWKTFSADPEWKQVAADSEANGKIVLKVDSTFLTATGFSPIK